MNQRKQRGIALFTTLVLLVIVTLASVVLIRNAGFENKMSGAYADYAVATGEVNGAIEEIIDTAQNGGANPFINPVGDYPLDETSTSFPDVDNSLNLIAVTPGDCFRSEEASSQNIGLSCRQMTADSTIDYSRSGSGQSNLVTGIVHPVIF